MVALITDDGTRIQINYMDGRRVGELIIDTPDNGTDAQTTNLHAVDFDFLSVHFRAVAARIRANGGH